MKLESASDNVLDQLLYVISQIEPDDYSVKIDSLGASIGQHIRHILEFYLRLIKGAHTGVVNYDLRERDSRIESDKVFAMEKIVWVKESIPSFANSKPLKLEVNYGKFSDNSIVIETNFDRELAYNIEHTIHHLAIIKNALNDFFDYVNLPQNFGIASSTIRYQKGS